MSLMPEKQPLMAYLTGQDVDLRRRQEALQKDIQHLIDFRTAKELKT